MTATELREARISLGLSTADLSKALRLGAYSDRTVRRWETGSRSIPGPVEVALEVIMACRAALATTPRNGMAIIANAMVRVYDDEEEAS